MVGWFWLILVNLWVCYFRLILIMLYMWNGFMVKLNVWRVWFIWYGRVFFSSIRWVLVV